MRSNFFDFFRTDNIALSNKAFSSLLSPSQLKVLSVKLEMDCKSSEFPVAKHVTDCELFFEENAFSNNKSSGKLLVEMLKKLPKLKRLNLTFYGDEFRDSLFQMISFESSQHEKMIVGPVYIDGKYNGTLIVKRKIRDFAIMYLYTL